MQQSKVCTAFDAFVVQEIREFLKDELFCDISIDVKGETFNVHKVILASHSKFFKAMFLSNLMESRARTIKLQTVCPNIFKNLISFMYGNELNLKENNVEDILFTSNMLQISTAVSLCSNYLYEQLDSSNCVGIFHLASNLLLHSLKNSSWNYIITHFNEVVQHDEFESLNFQDLCSITKSEDIKINEEVEVFSAIVKWVLFNPKERRKYFVPLFKTIRVQLIRQNDIETIYNSVNDQCLKIALKVLVSNISLSNTMTRHTPRNSARKSLYLIGGCEYRSTTQPHWAGNNIVAIPYIERFDMFANKWDVFSSYLKTPRCNFAASVIQNQLFIVGGENELVMSCSIDRFDNVDKKWTFGIGNLKHPRSLCSSVPTSDGMYIIGGIVGTDVSSSVEYFSYVDCNTTIALDFKLQQARHSFDSVIVNNICYSAGGIGASGWELKSMECYDMVKNEWWFARDMRQERSAFKLILHNNYIYAIGGFNSTDKTLATMEKYSIEENQWYACSPMNYERSGFLCTVINDKIYAIGGKKETSQYESNYILHESAEYYDVQSDNWVIDENMSHYRRSDGVAVLL